MTALLEVEDLAVDIRTGRGVIRAVDGVSFAVADGEALGLVGESGCGKTTSLRSILGLLPRNARVARGRITLMGENLLDPRPGAMRRARGRIVSMIFQEPMTALNPLIRVGPQIAEAMQVNLGTSRGEARAEAVRLMRRVGIAEPERRFRAYPHELSGGMRQRVMIAMALSCHPRLLLCDEPTTALDVTVQDQILSIIAALQREEGLSVVYVSHDLAVVAGLCQHVAVMYAGQIVETGTVEEIFRGPRHPYTLGLMSSAPRMDQHRQRLSPIPGSLPDLLDPPPGCRFHPRCRFAGAECTSGSFPLRPLTGTRATACIHADRCARPAGQEPLRRPAGEQVVGSSD
jgi:oligopeptide/dipeptide ABC transporter ATP-binding protein